MDSYMHDPSQPPFKLIVTVDNYLPRGRRLNIGKRIAAAVTTGN